MDIALNIAVGPSTTKARPRVAGSNAGPWKKRMLESQSLRRQERKLENKGSKSQEPEKLKHKTRVDDAAPASASTKSAAPPANASAAAATGSRSQKQHETAILRQQDNDAMPPIAQEKAAQPAKRQVISSLFSNTPKPSQSRENATVNYIEAENAVLDPSNAPSMSASFSDMPIRKELVSHLTGKMGLLHPTTVQKLAVPFLCDPSSSKKDALLQAQTGSGKTLSYLLPIIQDLVALSETMKGKGKTLERSVGTLAIILVPTRELANQIFEVANKLLGFASGTDNASHRWITPGLLTGGAHRQHEKARLRKGIPLLIATVSFAVKSSKGVG